MNDDEKKVKPSLPPEALAKYEALLRVLSGETSVTDAARTLGLSRQHVHELVSRAEATLLDVARGKAPGRPAKSEQEKTLEKENERLARENKKLKRTTDSLDDILAVTAKWLKHDVEASQPNRTPKPKAARTRASPTSSQGKPASSEPEEPDPAARHRRERLLEAEALLAQGVPPPIAAAAIRTSEATLKRWRARSRTTGLVFERPGPAPKAPLSAATKHEIRRVLEQLHGRVGVESLRRTIVAASRRQVAAVKAEVKTEMERSRRAVTSRVVIAAPQVVRGFDPVFANVAEGRAFVMNVQDGSVPFHTTLAACAEYDGVTVRELLERDFAENGAPLVLRVDRAKQHVTHEVLALLEAHEVLLMHGPPRHPRFYGQLERQNAELRCWLNGLGTLPLTTLQRACPAKREALNATWRRGSLGWRTAQEALRAGPRIHVDRRALRDEVESRAARMKEQRESRGWYAGKAERLAIEQALQHRGLLQTVAGGWGVR